MKIRRVEAELFHAQGHMTKLIVAFRNFENAPNNRQDIIQNDYKLSSHS